MVELTRGWNSRLGFSLQPEGNRTVISVVHPDSVAAKDGRLKQGDVLMMVISFLIIISFPILIFLLSNLRIRTYIYIYICKRACRDQEMSYSYYFYEISCYKI